MGRRTGRASSPLSWSALQTRGGTGRGPRGGTLGAQRSPGRPQVPPLPRSPVPEEAVDEIERSARSVEEAIEAALAELGATEQEVSVDIVQEPKDGFLGVRTQDAVVRVRRKS